MSNATGTQQTERLDAGELARVNRELAGASAEEVLGWAIARFGSGLRLASSMGGEDVVLIDLLSRVEGGDRVGVFMLDTGRLHQETYDVLDRIRTRYDRRVEVYFPRFDAIEALVAEHGPNSFYDSIAARKACCGARKLEPLARALQGAPAWITGLRRSQAVTRAETAFVEPDLAHPGLVKVNPLADWSEDQVWAWIRTHNVPYNPLHDQGFPSIGCAPCTRAIAPGEDVRAGRWWWENPELRECGLHNSHAKSERHAPAEQEQTS